MSDADLGRLQKELDYYRRRVDEVAAENIRLDVASSALNHELRQKRQGFALLSALHRSGAAHLPLPDLFQATLREIGTTLGMDRSVVLAPAGAPDYYQPRWWLGFHDDTAARFGSLSLHFPSEFAAGTGRLVVNKASASTPLVEHLRAAFELPFFVCLPVIAHRSPIALLLSGRLREARPLWPPLDQGDLDTFDAIAGLISASVELERVERLRSFLPPQLAEVIVASGKEALLEHHRREIATVFCDLRGFTAFSETSEPEVVMGVLQEFHVAMGELIARFEGTLEHIAGDGLMVFFNDPLPVEEPAKQAVKMAVAMRERVRVMAHTWAKRDYDLGFGVGISFGYATLGKVGYSGGFHYAAIGSVANLASRLCDEARSDQILVTSRVLSATEDLVKAEAVGALTLKGFQRPVAAFNVVGLKEGSSAASPA